MKRIGLTGGIGSGKTTVAKVFQTIGIPVYIADIRAKELMNTHKGILDAIKKEFGENAVNPAGINREVLAQIVFKDQDKLEKLNAIVHPFVFEDFENWTKAQKAVPYVMEEAAILFESGSHKKMDANIVVTAPSELRISRVMSRDKVTKEQVLARMNNQMDDAEKVKLADFVIQNDGSPILEQILKIHQAIQKL